MRRTTVLLLALLVLAAAAAATFYVIRMQSGQRPVTPGVKPAEHSRYTVVIPGGTSLKDALGIIRRRYLLKPDGRVLRALSEIDHFPGRAAAAVDIRAHWTESGWLIRANGRHTASLPRLPGFDVLFSLLKKEAAAKISAMHMPVGGAGPSHAGDMPDVAYAEPLIERLRTLDESAKPLSSKLEAAAPILARLAVLQPDTVGFGSKLPTHALAILALAEAAGHVRLYESESELAYALGYRHAALSLAKHLEKRNPWRLFVMHRDSALAMQTGSNGDTTTFAMYLELSRLAQRQDEAQWLALAANIPPDGLCAEGIYAQGLKLSSMTAYSRLASALSLLTIRCMNRNRPGNGRKPARVIERLSQKAAIVPVSTLVERFESLLKQQTGNMSGPFMTPGVYRSFRREAFYTGLYARFDYALSWRDVIGKAAALARQTAQAGSPDAQRLAAWEKDMLAAWQGKINPIDAAIDTSKDGDLAPGLKLRLISLAIDDYSTSDKMDTESIARIARTLDSRPAVREPLGDLLWFQVGAIAPAITLYKGAVAASARPDRLSVWLAGYLYGDKALLDIAGDSDVSPLQQDHALGQVEHPEKHAEEIVRRFQAILAQVPKAKKTTVYEDYLDMLHRLRMPSREVAVAYRFVHELPDYTPSLEVVEAHVYLARAYRHEGNLREAWRTIAPELPSWKEDAMGEGVKILLAMKRYKEAAQLAQVVLGRYPDSIYSLMSLVEAQWRMGKYEKAAQTLTHWNGKQLSAQWYPDVTKAFVRTFAGRDKARGKAVHALIVSGVNAVDLQLLVSALANKGDWKAAYQTIRSLPGPRGHPNLRQIADAYFYLQHWKGSKQANAWLARQVPHRAQLVLAMYLYHAYAYRGLWRFVQLPSTNADTGVMFDWILRIAARMQGARISGKQAQAIKAYFAQSVPADPQGKYYMELGRYLLGDDSKLAFIDAKLPRRKLTEAAYYLALHAAAEGHYTRAENWLRVSISGYFRRDGELYWSMALLSNWRNRNRTPEILRAQGRLFQPPFAKPARGESAKPPPTGGT